jgi:hypothetical protein
VVDRAPSAGEFWGKYPRSGQLISFNKRWTIYDDPEVNLRWDWNSLLTDVRIPDVHLPVYIPPSHLSDKPVCVSADGWHGVSFPQLQQKAVPR